MQLSYFRFSRMGLAAIAGLLSGGAAARATTFQLGAQSYDVEFVTGTGANATLVSIDFGAQAYNFGLRWDGAAPDGISVIDQIAANSAGALTVYSQFGGTFVTGFKYGPFDLNSDTFGTATPGDPSDDYPNLWVSFFESPDGANWDLPGGGSLAAYEVPAVDGGFQGWRIETTDWPGVELNAVNAVPEPASIGLFAVAAIGLSARRRRGAAGSPR